MRNSEKSHANFWQTQTQGLGWKQRVIYYIYSVKLKQWADTKWSWANRIAPMYTSTEVKSLKDH